MTEIAPTPAPLIHDILCIGCGYNLRGLEPSGRCPECGLAIADSNRGDRLAFADPAWLNKLRFGASLKLWNILIFILIGLAGGLAVGFMGAHDIVLTLAGAVASALGLWATYCITSQEPRVALTEDAVTLRKIIRVCAVTAFAGSFAFDLADGTINPGNIAQAAGWLWLLISFVSAVAGLIVWIGELKYFRRFALRAPDLQLARSTRILMWGLALTLSISSLGGTVLALIIAPRLAAGAAAPPGAFPISGAVMGIGACVFMAVTGVIFIWYIVLLSRYRKLFQTAIAQNQAART